MQYIDFISDTQFCSDCNRRLKSKTGIFSNGSWLGEICAAKRGIYKRELPDLTKAIIIENENTKTSSTKNNYSHHVYKQENNRQKCLSYLILRMEKLSDVKYMKHQILFELYEKYKSNNLSDGDYLHIENIINSVKNSNPIVSEENVYFCHAVKYALLNLIRKSPNNDFYKSILSYLQRNGTISKKQFEHINNKGIKIRYFSPPENINKKS
ncbi:FYVE zinc finger domain-containing protein [Treponema pectinovorum]|uniref:hypothetical protein n=1 Tax=Treponema pectinovorum TaxID=164 RepID=UPI0011CC27B3|nr:hypothetical protein [Treponema pectinovorum]